MLYARETTNEKNEERRDLLLSVLKDMGSEMLALTDFHTSHYLVVHDASLSLCSLQCKLYALRLNQAVREGCEMLN